MDPLTLGAIFGGGSLLKHFLFDKPRADRQRTAEAEKERYSPWTGHMEQVIPEPSLGNSMIQGGTAGAMLGANLEAADAQKKLMGQIGDKFQTSTPILPNGTPAQPVVPAQAGGMGPVAGYVPRYSSPWRLTDQSLYG